MTKTYTSYEFSKKLKAFLGERAPEPISNDYYHHELGKSIAKKSSVHNIPAYQLHDLLSKPFCEAMDKKCERKPDFSISTAEFILWEYYNGGLPAVEKALIEMMEESCKKN